MKESFGKKKLKFDVTGWRQVLWRRFRLKYVQKFQKPEKRRNDTEVYAK